MLEKVRAYIELMKPLGSSKSTLYYGFCSFVGSLLSASWNLQVTTSLTLAIAMCLGAFAIYALNDVYDVKIDAINAADRPLPSGRVTVAEAKALTVTLFALSLLTAWAVGFYPFAFTLLFCVLGVLYSLPPVRLKDSILANVAWGLGIASTVLGGAAVSGINLSAATAAFTMAFLTAGCGFMKDLIDIKGDRALNVHTLPVILGERRTIRTMTTFSAAGFPLLLAHLSLSGFNMAYLTTVAVAIGLFAYSLTILWRNPASKQLYKRAYGFQSASGFVIIAAFVVCALT